MDKIHSLSCFAQSKLLLQASSGFPPSPSPDHASMAVGNHQELKTASWLRIDSWRAQLELHQHFWWNTSGALLAQLLSSADYDCETENEALEFFLECIAPHLGPTRWTNTEQSWKSFMTDDGTPIEFSWDWTTTATPPRIRYSIEPVGFCAGSSADPYNTLVLQGFHNKVIQAVPGADFAWFDHFSAIFASSIFYAFDIREAGVVAKAYYVLRSESSVSQKSDWASVADAVFSAPQCSKDNLPAMRVLEKFFTNNMDQINIEMVAIDLVEPHHSRIKVYFRSRETNFGSVERSMTLDGGIQDEATLKGVAQLNSLWNEVFRVQGGESLPFVEHRTAGILYYAEFRLGSKLPSVKIYLPVRHYVPNDRAVIEALGQHFERADNRRCEKFRSYKTLLSNVFSEGDLGHKRGIHTYIGCSLNKDGTLRLISYLNPQVGKMVLNV